MSFRSSFEHRDDLLAAAIDEFCTHGFETASINRILTAASMSKGQLYHHFTNKQGLYLALVQWAIDEKSLWFEIHPPAPVEGFFAMLRAQLLATAAFSAAHTDVERFIRSLLTERHRPIFTTVQHQFAFDPDSTIGSLVQYHQQRGEFRSDLAPEFVVQVVLLVLNHLHELLNLNDPADLESRVDEIISFLQSGIGR